MSRIGKQPIPIPSGVEVKIGKEAVEVKGPKGELKTPCHPAVSYEIKDGAVTVSRVDDSQEARAQHHAHAIDIDDVAGVHGLFQLRITAHMHQLGDIHYHMLGKAACGYSATDHLNGFTHAGDIHRAAQHFNSLHD